MGPNDIMAILIQTLLKMTLLEMTLLTAFNKCNITHMFLFTAISKFIYQ